MGALLQKQQQTKSNFIQLSGSWGILRQHLVTACVGSRMPSPPHLPIFVWLLAALAGLSVVSNFLTSEARLK